MWRSVFGRFCTEVMGMPVKIKVKNSRGIRVEVKVRRPRWQQYITY